jgi:hypothetical protein
MPVQVVCALAELHLAAYKPGTAAAAWEQDTSGHPPWTLNGNGTRPSPVPQLIGSLHHSPHRHHHQTGGNRRTDGNRQVNKGQPPGQAGLPDRTQTGRSVGRSPTYQIGVSGLLQVGIVVLRATRTGSAVTLLTDDGTVRDSGLRRFRDSARLLRHPLGFTA